MNRLIDRSPRFDSISDIDTDAFDRTTDGPTDGLFTNARSFVRSRVALSHSCIESIARMNPSHPSTRASTSIDSLHIHTLRQSLPYYTYTYTIIDQHIQDLDASTDWRRSGLDCVGTAEGDSLMSPDPYTCVSLHARDPRPERTPARDDRTTGVTHTQSWSPWR